MGRDFAATVRAVQHDGAILNPDWESPLPQGSMLYYVGEHRLSPEEVSRALTER